MTTISSSLFLAVVIGYLVLLFTLATAGNRGWIPSKWVRHPITYVLSLGVYASAWAIYGVVGLAYRQGYNYLTYYLGISAIFLLAPLLLTPIMRLTQAYQLSSLADLFAYRYRSRHAGGLVTVAMIMGLTPLLALQLQSVAESSSILVGAPIDRPAAVFIALALFVFTVVFGARTPSTKQKHDGLVFVIAAESVVKLIALLALAAFCIFAVFDTPQGLQLWLNDNPQNITLLYEPLNSGAWHAMIGAFFFSAIVMPYMFHMIFTENFSPRNLISASWGLPSYFLILGACVPIIMWAAIKTDIQINPNYFSLGIALSHNETSLALLIYLGGLSAASGIFIISTLALSSMCVNHLSLSIFSPSDGSNIYRWVAWNKRFFTFLIVLLAYLSYEFVDVHRSQAALGMLSFIATLHFVPGVIGVLFWPRGNKQGLLWGIYGGLLFWAAMMLLRQDINHLFLPSSVVTLSSDLDVQRSILFGIASTFVNGIIYIIASLLTDISQAEQKAAESCAVDNLRRPYRWSLQAQNVEQFTKALTTALGATSAQREINIALRDLSLNADEVRPYALRRLRDQLESNLSGLLGPSRAFEIIDTHLPYNAQAEASGGEDIQFIENRLESYHSRLSGLAAELDSLRRFHRQTLYDLPLGVCSLSQQKEILSWNREMERLSGIVGNQVIGSHLSSLPAPWSSLLDDFMINAPMHVYSQQVQFNDETRWISLHKSLTQTNNESIQGSAVIVVEDISDLKQLEDQLTHNERLASVGRLAAGVAHEIGNPVTAISCLAQDLNFVDDEQEIKEMGSQILQQTERVNHIVRSLMGYSHAGVQSAFEAVDMHTAINEAIHLLTLDKHSKRVSYINECDEHLAAEGNSQRLMQVLINILSNARDASDEHSSVLISSEIDDGKLLIHITDNGHGIDKSVANTIFEPFVTTKPAGQGTGLGLSLVYSILQEHYGSLEFISPYDTQSKRGTRATITLPLLEGEQGT